MVALAPVLASKSDLPARPGAVGLRPALDQWQAKLDAATAAAPVDVVLIHDSLWDISGGTESAAQFLHRSLNAAAGVQGADPLGVSLIPLPVHAQGAGPTATSTNGTTSTTATGGQGSTLTTGQILTHTATATGFSVAYRTEPGWGSMVIRDGAGGTVLATVSCSAAAKSGNVWTSGALSNAVHTLHITASGGTVRPEIIMPTRGTKVRVWPAGWAGAKTNEITATTALDLVANLSGAGSLGLVIVATGTNDDAGYPTAMPALLASIAGVTSADRVIWLPNMMGAFPQSEADAARVTARASGVPLIDASVVVDQTSTLDGTHPVGSARAVMAAHVSAALGGDPIGAAIRLGAAVASGRGATFSALGEAGLSIGSDLSMFRVAASAVGIGSGLSMLFGAPDGTTSQRYVDFNEAATDPAAPAANHALVYTKDNGAGKTQLCVRFATGAIQVVATQP